MVPGGLLSPRLSGPTPGERDLLSGSFPPAHPRREEGGYSVHPARYSRVSSWFASGMFVMRMFAPS